MKTNPPKTRTPSVLCGTDFSPAARQAADVACSLAQCLHTSLALTHVSEIPAFPELLKELGAEANRLRQSGASVHDCILIGHPGAELVKRAKPKTCKLVVVSSLGKREFQRWLLGSVSERTAERAAVPTLVVRDPGPLMAWTRGERPLKVFVAFNFTDTSEAALRWVSELQAIGPCEVVVGYVEWPPEQRLRLAGKDPQELMKNLPEVRTILERELKTRITEILGTSAGISTRVEANWGRPDAPLAGMAKEAGADLIVVGSHQYHGFERLWKTSVSSGLLHNAAMSVLVVPRTSVKKPRGSRMGPPIRKVLVTTDFSELANLAIPYAYSLLRGGGTVHLAHVVHPDELAGGEHRTGAYDRQFEMQHAKLIHSCEKELQALVPPEATLLGILTDVEVVEHSDPATGICVAAEKAGVDAICTATHGRSGLSKVLLGSVAQRVLARSSRPLLLVRPPLEP